LNSFANSSIVVSGGKNDCGFKAQVNCIQYQIKNVKTTAELSSVGVDKIIDGKEWSGSDYHHSKIDGMRVFGSWIKSDADTGTISLLLEKSDSFFYRSGPTGGQQYISINGIYIVLPVSEEWVKIEINDEQLSDQFTVKIIDNGTGWGEWSAVALIDNYEGSK
jgi:hypothetical protein